MKCPGQDMQYWKDDAIFEVSCPECKAVVEFYKDDTTRKCNACGNRFVNPKLDFGCASYCQFAEQCIGSLPEDFVLQQDNLLKDKVAVEVKRYLKNNFKQIRLATTTARFAENIGKATGGVNLAALLCSAYLSYLSLKQPSTDLTTGSDDLKFSPDLQEIKAILTKLDADNKLIETVTSIVNPSKESGNQQSQEKRILEEALLLTMIENSLKEKVLSDEDINESEKRIQTEAGLNEFHMLLEKRSV